MQGEFRKEGPKVPQSRLYKSFGPPKAVRPSWNSIHHPTPPHITFFQITPRNLQKKADIEKLIYIFEKIKKKFGKIFKKF